MPLFCGLKKETRFFYFSIFYVLGFMVNATVSFCFFEFCSSVQFCLDFDIKTTTTMEAMESSVKIEKKNIKNNWETKNI